MTLIASISKDFAFSASHQLAGLPPEHQCSRLHGHNYVVRVTITGPVNDIGFVIDYGELAPIKALIDDELDHRHLNELLDFNPTAELMAEWLAARVRSTVPGLTDHHSVMVALSETPKTWAEAQG